MRTMTSVASRFIRFYDEFRAARACAAAMDSGHRPSRKVLKTLNIDESIFDRQVR